MRYVLILLILAGCATPAEQAAKDIASYSPYCEALGYQPQTEKWRDCIMAKAGSEDAATSRYGAAVIQSRPRTCLPTNGGMTCF